MKQSKPKKRKKRASSLLVFGLTFLLFLVVFGGVLAWGMMEFTRQITPPVSSSSGTSVNAPTYSEADTRRLLIVTEQNKQAQGFVLVVSEPALARVRAIAIPRETTVAVGVEQTRLFELYTAQGITAVRDSLAAALGVTVDHYAIITYANIEKAVAHFDNSLLFTLPETLSYTDESGGYTIKLTSGAHMLTGSQVTGVLAYPAGHGGRRQRATVQAQVVAAMINQYLTVGRAEKRDRDFTALVNLVRSDIYASQYHADKAAIEFLASRNNGSLCTALSANGEYIGNGEAMRFELSEKPLG